MAFDVGIKITAESQLEGVKQAEAAVQQLGQTVGQVGGAAVKGAAGLDPLEKGLKAAYLEARPLRAGLSEVISQLGLTGPAAHVAAFSILNAEEGLSRMTVSAIGAGIGLTAMISSIKFLDDEKTKFDKAFQSKDINAFTKDMEQAQEVLGSRSGFWGAVLTPLQVLGGAIGVVDKSYTLFSSNLKDKIAADQRAIKTIGEQIASDVARPLLLEAEATKAQLAGDPVAVLAAQQRVQMDALLQGMTKTGVMGEPLRTAAGALQTKQLEDYQKMKAAIGMPLIDEGIKQIGVTADLTTKEMNKLAIEAFHLSQDFQSGKISGDELRSSLREMASDAVQAKAAFGPLVEEVKGYVQIGAQKISLAELSPAGGAPPMGSQLRAALVNARNEISDLAKQGAEFGFLPDPTKLQQLKDQLQGFGELATKEFGIDVPQDIATSNQSLTGLVDKFAQKYQVHLDAKTAYDAISQANVALDQLRANAASPIVLNMQVAPGGKGNMPGGGSLTLDTSTGTVTSGGIVLGVPGQASPGIPAGQDLRGIQAAFNMTPQIVESPAVPFSKWLSDIAPAKIKNFTEKVADMGLVFKPKASGSPTLPLTDYFGNYAVGVVNNFVQQASQAPLTLATGFTQAFFNVQSQIIDAEGTIAQINAARMVAGADFVGDMTAGVAKKLEGLKEAKREILGYGLQPQGAGGSGGGGGATMNITIDMRDALITGDVINSNLLPTLRDLVRQTTGKDPGMRTLN